MGKNKILHVFLWHMSAIMDNLEDIKNSGWNSILLTPVQPSKDETRSEWYMRYQPTGLTIGNKYGSKEQLIELCKRAHDLKLNVYVDTIITHFGNKSKEEELIAHENVDTRLVNNSHFWRDKKYIDYNDRYSVTHHCNGLASVITENYDYQDLVINFLNEMIDCGVDGIRLDSAKMIALPEEDFNEQRNEFFIRVLNNVKKPLYVFGEVIFETKRLINMYEKYIDVLTEFNAERSYELNKSKTILFIESHDTYNDDNIGYTSNWKTETVVDNYKYLARDFEKVLFYSRPHENEWKSNMIKEINWEYK